MMQARSRTWRWRVALAVTAAGLVLEGIGLFVSGHRTMGRVGLALFVIGTVAAAIAHPSARRHDDTSGS